MEKHLLVCCDSGLANRMHAIAGAKVIAEETGRVLNIWWPENNACGAQFADLFDKDVLPGVEFVDECQIGHLLTPTSTRVKVYNCGLDATATNEWQQMALNDMEDVVVIKSWYIPRFGGAGAPEGQHQKSMAAMRNIFSYSDELRQRVLGRIALLSKFAVAAGGNLFGVHIRYGDRMPGTTTWNDQICRKYAKSDTASFCVAMDFILRERPNAKFVVASCNPEVVQCIRSMYGDRVFNGVEESDRTTREGMLDAAVELFTLGLQSRFVIGSYYSQFSQVAAEYHRRPLVVVGSEGYLDVIEALLKNDV